MRAAPVPERTASVCYQKIQGPSLLNAFGNHSQPHIPFSIPSHSPTELLTDAGEAPSSPENDPQTLGNSVDLVDAAGENT